jgi:rubrerythrin
MSFIQRLQAADQRQLIQLLRIAYVGEVQDAVQFAHHAQRMYYPQFREQLLRIVSEEQAHAQWLREQLHALGDEVSEPAFSPKMGKNSWECLRMDVEAEKRSCHDLLQLLHVAERMNAELVESVRRLRQEERRHHEEMLGMLMKSEPYALPSQSLRADRGDG